MANQRSDSQTLLAFTLDRSLAAKVDRESRKAGKNRSQFIRDAIAAYLSQFGETISLEETLAPDRRRIDMPVVKKKINFREGLAPKPKIAKPRV